MDEEPVVPKISQHVFVMHTNPGGHVPPGPQAPSGGGHGKVWSMHTVLPWVVLAQTHLGKFGSSGRQGNTSTPMTEHVEGVHRKGRGVPATPADGRLVSAGALHATPATTPVRLRNSRLGKPEDHPVPGAPLP